MALNPPLTVPNRYDPGTLIRAAAINDNFSALTNAINANARVALGGPLTLYVAPGGHDTGIPTNSAQPAATMGYVLNLLWNNYDLANQQVIIQLADGSYNESVIVRSKPVGQRAGSAIMFQGNQATPANVIVTGNPPFSVGNHASCSIQGMRLAGGVSCLVVQAIANAGVVNVDFNTATGQHILVRENALFIPGNYTISAGSGNHWLAQGGGIIDALNIPQDGSAPPAGQPTITLLGGLNFSTAFASVSSCGVIRSMATFSGTATGVRYTASLNGVIQNYGRNDLPGNAPGTLATGGQYA